MKNSIYVIFFFFLIISCHKTTNNNPACSGRERWNVKALYDADEGKVNYSPITTTISELLNYKPQGSIDPSAPRNGIEFNTYTVECRIREYEFSDDGDYSLVITDLSDPSKTMIAEIPDPFCSETQKSRHNEQFMKVRNDFVNTLKLTSQPDTGIYIITGVAFFDYVHGQRGVAPNGIEIHPILSIRKKE